MDLKRIYFHLLVIPEDIPTAAAVILRVVAIRLKRPLLRVLVAEEVVLPVVAVAAVVGNVNSKRINFQKGNNQVKILVYAKVRPQFSF